jgi:large subunit ribosomal protein L10
VVINQKITLAKEGEIVPAKTADILKTMEIFPRNVGLELRAAYEGGLIFKSKDLSVNVEGKIAELCNASAKALSFAVEIGYTTPVTIGPMLQKAQTKARALVLEAGIPVPSMMEFVLAKAAANAQAIASISSGKTAPAAAAAAAPAAEEEKEEKKEGDTTAGLGALFG